MNKRNKSNYIQIIKITDPPSRRETDKGKTFSGAERKLNSNFIKER